MLIAVENCSKHCIIVLHLNVSLQHVNCKVLVTILFKLIAMFLQIEVYQYHASWKVRKYALSGKVTVEDKSSNSKIALYRF